MDKQKGKRSILAGLFIMIGLIVVGICIVIAVGKYKSYDRVVNVKGLCEKEVAADKVIWPIAYKLVGNDITSIYNEIQTKNQIIIDFLKSNGIKEESLSIGVPKIIDLAADRYSNSTKDYRYNVSSVITVTSSDIEKTREVMSKQTQLLTKGIAIIVEDYSYSVEFSFNGLNDIKPTMIEEATQNARAVADKFAKDSKSTLGAIKSASQGQFSITNRDENTPYKKIVRVVTSVSFYLK